jgi:DNA-binding NtrC family response regulator
MSSPRVHSTILLIGDQDAVQATRADELRRQGYRVLTAAYGLEVEALGQRLGLESFALVILDLPWTDAPQVGEGSTFVQRWGAQAPHLPFIVISDAPMPSRLHPPVVWWLTTPLTLDTLLMAVRDSLGG